MVDIPDGGDRDLFVLSRAVVDAMISDEMQSCLDRSDDELIDWRAQVRKWLLEVRELERDQMTVAATAYHQGMVAAIDYSPCAYCGLKIGDPCERDDCPLTTD